MKKQKIVLFDIDYTLFDVSYFDRYFYKELSKKINVDEDLIREKSVQIIKSLIEKESFLDIDKYIKLLFSSLKKSKYKKEAEDILFSKSFFREGFYKDVKKALGAIKNIARIGIFSQGDYKFQWSKIKQSDFKHFFDKDVIYIIKPRKLDFLPILKEKHKNDRLYLVDDKPIVIHEVKKYMPSITTIWLRRGSYIEQSKDISNFKPDAIIDDLFEVVSIINKN